MDARIFEAASAAVGARRAAFSPFTHPALPRAAQAHGLHKQGERNVI